MRPSRVVGVGCLAAAVALLIPGSAMAAGTQRVEAGFVPEFNSTVPIPPPTLMEPPGFTKGGTLYTRLFLEGPENPVPEAAVFNIHAPEELKFNTKGLAECDPAAIRNQSADAAKQICPDSLIGQGSAEAWLGGPTLTAPTVLFNGTKQAGFSTVLFHSTAGTPVTLISEMRQSSLPGYGTLFSTKVAQSAGGGVPDGIPIVDTSFTISKKYTDKNLLKKAKKAKKKGNTKKYKKLKKKSKKSWVQARCTDGMGVTRVEVTYVTGPSQSDETVQPCVP